MYWNITKSNDKSTGLIYNVHPKSTSQNHLKMFTNDQRSAMASGNANNIDIIHVEKLNAFLYQIQIKLSHPRHDYQHNKQNIMITHSFSYLMKLCVYLLLKFKQLFRACIRIDACAT